MTTPTPVVPEAWRVAHSPTLSVGTRALSVMIRGYQAAHGGRPSPCRYWPTCSTYALEALEAHGARHGTWLTARRLLRCHPWALRSGVDLVPEPSQVTG